MFEFNKDAFSSGQVGSKIWLCEELEKTGWKSKLTYIYGGWHGITAFLLLSRGKFQVDKIRRNGSLRPLHKIAIITKASTETWLSIPVRNISKAWIGLIDYQKVLA